MKFTYSAAGGRVKFTCVKDYSGMVVVILSPVTTPLPILVLNRWFFNCIRKGVTFSKNFRAYNITFENLLSRLVLDYITVYNAL